MSKIIFAAVAALAVLSSPAFAGDTPERLVQPVSASGVDFTDVAAVRALHVRLAKAAEAVCDSYTARGRVTAEDRACASTALTQAVRAADKPLLTAVHQGDRDHPVYAEKR